MKKSILISILLIFIPSTLLSAAQTKSRNAALSIAPTTVMQKQSKNEHLFLVDVRNDTEFAKFKIPGAINIPLAFIKSKPFLKTHPVVLINEGFVYTEMEKEAVALNQSGFNVKILEGGLWAWKHKEGPMVGDPFSQQQLNKLSPRAFFQEKDFDNLIIIDASSSVENKNKALPVDAIALSPDENALTVSDLVRSLFLDRKKLKQDQKKINVPKGLDLVKKSTGDPLLSVVIATETGEEYPAIEKEMDKACLGKVFFLEGGWEAYRKFLNFKLLANRPRKNRVKVTDGCEECGKANMENKLN